MEFVLSFFPQYSTMQIFIFHTHLKNIPICYRLCYYACRLTLSWVRSLDFRKVYSPTLNYVFVIIHSFLSSFLLSFLSVRMSGSIWVWSFGWWFSRDMISRLISCKQTFRIGDESVYYFSKSQKDSFRVEAYWKLMLEMHFC